MAKIIDVVIMLVVAFIVSVVVASVVNNIKLSKLIDKLFWPVVFILSFVATIVIAMYQLDTIRTIDGIAFVPMGCLLLMALVNEIKNAIVILCGGKNDE